MKIGSLLIMLSIVALAAIGFASAMTCEECDESCDGECVPTGECTQVLAITDGGSQPVYAGQSQDAGTLSIEITDDNDDGVDDTLLLTYDPAGCWDLDSVTEQFKANIYTSNDLPTSRPIAGQFPYKETNSYEIKIPLSAVKEKLGLSDGCPTEATTLYIVAHLDLACKDSEGNVVTTDTAFAGENKGPGNAWWYYSGVTFGCDEECYCDCVTTNWCGETAWAAGNRYVKKGNWATYTPYDGSEKIVTLYAGQTMEAGTVTFSAPAEGKVTITITLNDGWRFADVDENVKVQDYAAAPPSGNPSPGLFAWKATFDVGATSDSIDVPLNNYYGVHVDVERKC